MTSRNFFNFTYNLTHESVEIPPLKFAVLMTLSSVEVFFFFNKLQDFVISDFSSTFVLLLILYCSDLCFFSTVFLYLTFFLFFHIFQ